MDSGDFENETSPDSGEKGVITMKTFFLVCLYIFLVLIVVGIAGRLLRKTESGRGVFLGRRDQILKMASLSSLDRTTVWFVTFRMQDGSEMDLKTTEWVSDSLKEGNEYDLTWKGMILKKSVPVTPDDGGNADSDGGAAEG